MRPAPQAIMVIVAAVILTWNLMASAQVMGFEFHPPKDWIEIAPGPASADQLEKLTPNVREASTRLAVSTIYYAAPLGFDGSMSATLRAEADSEPIDEGVLERAANDLGYHKLFVVEQKRIEIIEQRAWGRFVGRTPNGSRFLLYLVPGKPRSVFLLFTTPAESFEGLEAALDAAARSTKGAGDPARRSRLPTELLVIGGLAVAALAAIRVRRSRRVSKRVDKPSHRAKTEP